MAIQFRATGRNAALAALIADIGDSPTLRIRTGETPANVAAPRTGTILASVDLAEVWAGTPVNGISTFASIPEFAALESGEAGYFELMQDAVCVAQGTVTATGGGGDMQLGAPDLTQNVLVRINLATLTQGGA